MPTPLSDGWSKTYAEPVDQRALRLPPTWTLTGDSSAQRVEQGNLVLESGPRRVVADLVRDILSTAREKVLVSSFLLADSATEYAILGAAQRGVRVYVLLASETRLGPEGPDGEFDRRALEEHKAMLLRLAGNVLFRSAPHFHAKFVLADPVTQPRGVVLTANLTKEALERNDELAVVLTPVEVVELASLARWAMWETAEHEMVDPTDRFRAVQPLGKVDHPHQLSSILATTSTTNALRTTLLELVDTAKSEILVSSFGWDLKHALVQRLCARAREGVAVTVLSRPRQAAMPALVALAEAGARVHGFSWLHGKALWVDTGTGVVMSANLQSHGLDDGFEVGVRLEGERARALKDRLQAWCASARFGLAASPRLGEVAGRVTLWRDNKLVPCEVLTTMDVDAGSVTAASAHDLRAPRPALAPNGSTATLAHLQRISWTVKAPVLAEKSAEVIRPASGKEPPRPYVPPVFREPGGRLVVVADSPSVLPQARAVMAEVSAASIVVPRGQVQ